MVRPQACRELSPIHADRAPLTRRSGAPDARTVTRCSRARCDFSLSQLASHFVPSRLLGMGVAVVAAVTLAGCSGGTNSARTTIETPLTHLSVAEAFFNGQGVNGWMIKKHFSQSEYEVTGKAANRCTVTINGPTESSQVTRMGVICKPPTVTNGTVETSVPANEVALVDSTVQKFAPADYSWVRRVRTFAAASEHSTFAVCKTSAPCSASPGVSLTVNSSPPLGSNLPVINLSIRAGFRRS
jgi:hypothetical protein